MRRHAEKVGAGMDVNVVWNVVKNKELSKRSSLNNFHEIGFVENVAHGNYLWKNKANYTN